MERLNMDTTFGQNDQADPDEDDAAFAVVDVTSVNPIVYFIGPELPQSREEPDLEETLSEFYRELEDLNPPDVTVETSGAPVSTSVAPLYIPLSLQPPEVPGSRLDPGEQQERMEQDREQKQSSWPHWYDNRPYHRGMPRSFLPTRSEREEMNPNEWQRRQPVTRQRAPPPRFHRPRLHRPAPPTPFPYRQNPPPFPPAPSPAHMIQDWGSSVGTNRYDEEPCLPVFPPVSPPNFDSHFSVRPVINSGRYFDHHQHDYDDNEAPSSSAGGSWPPYENEGRYQCTAEPDPSDPGCPPADEDSPLVMILMRGLPGSGKTTLARKLTCPNGIILSTDDYFLYTDGFQYEQSRVMEAHEWNRNRAEDAMRDSLSPVIIDSNNLQAWEMKPYVSLALQRGYRVDFCEPDTDWKFDPCELEWRNKHRVPQEKIAQMMDRFCLPISVDIVMSSQEPSHTSGWHE